MNLFRLFPLIASVCVMLPLSVRADDSASYPDVTWSLVQVTLIPGQLSVVSPETPVIGVNLAPFWGGQKQVFVLNLQLLYGKSEEIRGLSVQGCGTTREFAGLQFGGVTFLTRFQGVSFSLAGGAWENRGLQVGLANFSGNTVPAFSKGDGEVRDGGMQLGIFNSATGGLQIGLLNYNENSPVPWMILFNVSTR